MLKLSWTINLTTGPAVGSATADTLDECMSEMETALKQATPGKWTHAHAEGLGQVRHALAAGQRNVTATSFLVTLED